MYQLKPSQWELTPSCKLKKLVLLAFGENKEEVMKRLKNEDVSEDFPASILKKHPHVTVFHGE